MWFLSRSLYAVTASMPHIWRQKLLGEASAARPSQGFLSSSIGCRNMTFPGGKHFRAPLVGDGMMWEQNQEAFFKRSCPSACRSGLSDPGKNAAHLAGLGPKIDEFAVARYQAARRRVRRRIPYALSVKYKLANARAADIAVLSQRIAGRRSSWGGCPEAWIRANIIVDHHYVLRFQASP